MPNQLAKELSPYLLQHAHNPVNWYAWGDEAFEKAEKEHKPVLVSIGYAACHWCHVMERESFENEEVAAYMNEHFINIKVDREEHPDVDHLYMDAVQAISGSGGWPLNVFVTPSRVPFYGGTYFPPRPAYGRPSWLQLLQRMYEIWTEQPGEVETQTNQMLQYLKQASAIGTTAKGEKWDKNTCTLMAENLLKHADKEKGGFGKAPKFPGTMSISYLLQHYRYTGNKEALQHAFKSLDAMIEGGIYDQLGGGLARYATDDNWLIPHFEKMLYDNALLVTSLAEAYGINKDKKYKIAIEEIIGFVEKELREPGRGYYSAIDADSEGVEGKFYTWTWDEWKEIIGEDEVLQACFDVSEEGNWEHTNILHVAEPVASVAMRYDMPEAVVAKKIAEAKQKLLAARNTRIRPLTDDKSLLSWNALMNIALCKAAQALQDDTYRQRAVAHMEWMLQAFQTSTGLMHTWKQGKARIAANLDDYAYLVQALLQLASVSGDEAWLLKADELVQKVINEFQHESSVFFYYTSSLQNDIPVRKVDIYDGATPSANAVMAHNLYLLGIVMERTEWIEQAYIMLQRMASSAGRYTTSFGYWACLLQQYVYGIKTVAGMGEGWETGKKELEKEMVPGAFLLTSKKEISEIPMLKGKYSGKETRVYICTDDACLPPIADIAQVLKHLHMSAD